MKELEKECAEYLKSKSGLRKLADACIQKYEQLEHIGGSIQLKDLTSEELHDVGALLGRKLKQEPRISFSTILQAIERTRFSGSDMIQVLSIIKGSEFVFYHQEKQKEEERFSSFCHALLEKYQSDKVYDWLEDIIQQKGYLYRQIKEMWINEIDKLTMILKAINTLPVWKKERELVVVFAQQISKNPHFFDGGIQESMLLSAISFYFCRDMEIENELKKTEVFYYGGLIKDDMSNFCMIAHLSAIDEDGVESSAWKGFCEAFEPWIVNLYNLNQVASLKTPSSVYIVENPSTFRTLCMFAKEHHIMNAAFICTYGQLNFSAYVLLDKLNFKQSVVYYQGDFDPEGMMIADKLKKRYPELNLWHYSRMDYELSISDNLISDRRMKMLDHLLDPELRELSFEIKRKKYAGYQESLHENLKLDLEK